MKSRIQLIIFMCLSLFVFSCNTDDVSIDTSSIEVNLSVDLDTIPVENGQAKVLVKLNSPALLPVSISFSFSGEAILGNDFSVDQENVVIPTGESEATLTISTLDSINYTDGMNIIVGFHSVENAQIGSQNSIEIILDKEATVIPLIINEVLYDPSNAGLEGDANGDGVYSQAEDEFIEFVNISNADLDISGYKIYDADGLAANVPVHIFPSGSILSPKKALVVFGGGNPTGNFGNSIVQTSTTGNLSLNNEVDFITVTNANDEVVATFDIAPLSNNPNESFTRNPDITGDFVRHKTINSRLFSPGTKVDGSNF